MRYHRLTHEERYQIQGLLASGASLRKIAKVLGRSCSTISREISKEQTEVPYSAVWGQSIACQRRKKRYEKQKKIRGLIAQYVEAKLLLDWSPEQIAGRAKLLQEIPSISHMTIYRYIEREKACGGEQWKHLRILRRQQKDRKSAKWHPIRLMPDRVMISERPKIVEKRIRLGDYERDTMLGVVNGAMLLSIVDRKSKLLKLSWIPRKSAELVHQATVSSLKDEPVHTITNDNGTEFTNHAQTAKELGAKIYFSRAYRAWERGTNENTNGLLRQYFPKRRKIKIEKSKVKQAEWLLNTRPRKTLGYKTPLEVHESLKRRVLRWSC